MIVENGHKSGLFGERPAREPYVGNGKQEDGGKTRCSATGDGAWSAG